MITNTKDILTQANQFYKQGNLRDAEDLCKKAITLNPAFAEAYNLLGLISDKKKEFTSSISFYRTALKIVGNNPQLLSNLGNSLFYLNKFDESLKTLQKAVALNPNYYHAHFNLGKVYKAKQDFTKAAESFNKTIELKPDYIPALNNLANLYHQQNENEKAEQLYLKAISLSKENVQLQTNLGNFYLSQNKYENALDFFNQAVKLDSTYEDAVSGILKVFTQQKEYLAAEKELDKLLNLKPEDANLLFLKANLLKSKGSIAEAIHYYKTCLRYKPDHVMCLNNLGQTYITMAMNEEAEAALVKACNLDSNCFEAWYALAKINELKKNHGEAQKILANLLKEKGIVFRAQVLYDYMLLKLRVADWNDFKEDTKKVIEETESYLENDFHFSLSPLTLNYFDIDPSLHLKVAKSYAKNLMRSMDLKTFEEKKEALKPSSKKTKLRIGYLSPDFRQHAVGLLIKDLFKFHSDRVETYAYSIVNNEDELNVHFKNTANQFVDITKLSHLDVALRIKEDEIDILIDLGGYTSYTRPQIMAYRAAPVQINFLGYPDTSGSEFIDYILADPILIDEKLKSYYTEKILHLNHAFFSSHLSEKKITITRKEVGLPENAFVFCCFNSYYKFTPDLWDDWMQLLKQAPDSVLWLTTENEQGMNNLLNETKKRNIDPSRIIFAERKPMEEYIASYSCADLFLDTHHYSAGSTAVCAVWGGVPVLTLKGKTNASCMGTSIATAAHLDEFITANKSDYINKALSFYKDREQLKTVRNRLNVSRNDLPLFDLKRAVENLEDLLIRLKQ